MNTAVQGFVHLGIIPHCIPQMHIRASIAFNKGVGFSSGNVHSLVDGKNRFGA